MTTRPFSFRIAPKTRMFCTRTIGALLATATLAACSSDATSPGLNTGAQSVSLSVMTNTLGTTTPVTLPRSSANITVVLGQDTLVITKAQVVLSRLELTTGLGTDCDDIGEDDHGHHCTELKRSFVVIDLPIDTAVHTISTTAVPPGTYSSLEARLRVPHPDSDASATTFLAAHPEFANADVRVEGTFHGTPFVYTGAVSSKLELDFSPPVVVDSTGLNVTVNIDLSTWFQDGTGALVDPATANAGGTNAALVDDNIRRSFHVFRDDHRNGHEDGHEDNGHGGDDDGQSGHH